MRTLDEVIESITTQSGLEIRNVGKPERDRFWVDRDTYNDALHYLREYQTLQYGYIKAMADLEDNPPLTWDELRQMEGKPVWIWLSPRIKNTPGSGRWEIIYKFNPIGGNKNLFEMEMESRSRFTRKYQGDLWQAYRKERNETGD